MVFRFFSKKNGKWTEKEKLESSDTRVTKAVKTPSNEDPEVVQIGTTIRVLWIPSTLNTYCWVQGEVTEASISEVKGKKGVYKTNEVTIENLILVRCLGVEYCEKLPPQIQIVLNPNQNWELGPEPTLGTGEEDEIIQIDTDAIPREVSRTNSDSKIETETDGATGGSLVNQRCSLNQSDPDNLLNSEDESSDDEASVTPKEEEKVKKLRDRNDAEEISKRRSDNLIKQIEKVAETKRVGYDMPKNIKETCNISYRGMNLAFIAGVLTTPTGSAREDSIEYAQNITHGKRRATAYDALHILNAAKKRLDELKLEEYGKLSVLLKDEGETFSLTKYMLQYMTATVKETKKKAKEFYKNQEVLGARSRTSSKTRQSGSKVKFSENLEKEVTTPSAPFKEDLVDENDKPPKYDAVQNGSETFPNMMQTPGGFIYNQPMQQFPPYGWPQQLGAYQNLGYDMNTLEMKDDWIENQINYTRNLLRNRGFSRDVWDYFLIIPREWEKDDMDPIGVHKGVKAVLTARGSVSPWWIPATQVGDKVKLSTSFNKVIQVLDEVNRFKDESMPDDSQLNAEYNRAEKRANKLHEKLQEACSNLSELASCADQTNYEFYDFILDFVDKVKTNDEARKKAEKMKTLLSTKGIVTQQNTVSSDYLKTQLPVFDGESSLSILEAIDTWRRIFKNAGVHPQMWGSWILEKIKEPATSSLSPGTKRNQVFDDICEELKKKYSGAVEVAHNLMETHLKIGRIPDPSKNSDASLKALIAHFECMEHASRYIELSGNARTEGEILTGTYLKKMLSFIPPRVRQHYDEFDDAETTTELRKEQYKKIKEWILKIRKKLLSSGTNMEEDIEDKVTMMTVNNQNSKNSYKSERNNYNRNGSQRSNQGQRRGGQESSRNTITECAFCELIRNKDVTQVYLKRGFKERHMETSNNFFYPNQCLAWLRLSMDDREKVLTDNKIRCRICLRHFRDGENKNDVCKKDHLKNTGRNGSCFNMNCEYNSTTCREHYNLNKEKHRLLITSKTWADKVDPQPVRQHMSFLMQVGEDKESTSKKVKENYNNVRKEIQINTEELNEAFDNISQNTSLLVVEDRRNNKAQFDLAYTNIDGEKVLTTFDTCSNVTLILEDLIKEKRIKVLHTEESSNIEGVGGAARGKVVEFEISNRFGKRIRIKASVVDKIATVPFVQQNEYNELIEASVQEVRKAEGFENTTADNFQLVPGGKIELLLGLDAGTDFFPEEISNFKSGLKVSQYRMNMFDPARTLGFSGSFPAKYTPMYLPADHPKTLILQENPKIDNTSVFQRTASVLKTR